MWEKIKSWGWVKTLLLVLSSVLLALTAAKASNKRIQAKRKEQTAENLLNSGTSKEIAEGKKLMEAANVDKDVAVEARVKMVEQLDAIGDQNEDLADIATRFNKRTKRVRKPS